MYGLAPVERILTSRPEASLPVLCEAIKLDLNQFVQGEFPDDVAFILVEF
jgi:hypothetical protein